MYAIYLKNNDQPISVYEYFDEAVNEMRELFNIYYNENPIMANKLQVVNLSTGKVVY